MAPQWIGDAVMTEPLMRRLAARGEQLTVGALPWVAPIYRAMPQVEKVIEFPFAHGGLQLRTRWMIAKQLSGQFDTAYVLPNSLKSALLPFLASIPKRVGYLGECRVGLLTHRLKNPKNKPPMVAFYSALSGEDPQPFGHPKLAIAPALVERALRDRGLWRGAYVVFAPGAEFGSAKRWPAVHFAELAALLDVTVVLLGSAKEAALCEQIATHANAQAPGRCLNLAGLTSLPQALSLIAGSRHVVSNDSGLMHVAAALGVPQVAVFGSSSPLHTPPLNRKAVVLWLKTDASYQPPLDCAPCFQRECPLPPDQGQLRCLQDIRVAAVLQALQTSATRITPN